MSRTMISVVRISQDSLAPQVWRLLPRRKRRCGPTAVIGIKQVGIRVFASWSFQFSFTLLIDIVIKIGSTVCCLSDTFLVVIDMQRVNSMHSVAFLVWLVNHSYAAKYWTNPLSLHFLRIKHIPVVCFVFFPSVCSQFQLLSNSIQSDMP